MNNNFNNGNDPRRSQNGNRTPQNQPRSGMPQSYRQNVQSNGQYQRPPQSSQYPPIRHKSRRQAQKAARMAVLAIVIVVMLLISMIIFAARCAMGENGTVQNGDLSTVTTAPVTTEPLETEPPETELDPAFQYLEKSSADMHRGYQILINAEHAYNFDGGFELKNLYANKEGLFAVMNTSDSLEAATLDNFLAMMRYMGNSLKQDILVTSADRTFEDQQEIYASQAEKKGEEYAMTHVALPGYSEHHTGLAADLAIINDAGESYTFDDKPEYSDWLKANGHKFGFIERYREDKVGLTNIAYENWHYRYVGKPHAFYMATNNLCMEEYIDMLRSYTYESTHLVFADDEGVSWEIYFVPADESGYAKVPVPRYLSYEVSGNNVDGFIVTVKN